MDKLGVLVLCVLAVSEVCIAAIPKPRNSVTNEVDNTIPDEASNLTSGKFRRSVTDEITSTTNEFTNQVPNKVGSSVPYEASNVASSKLRRSVVNEIPSSTNELSNQVTSRVGTSVPYEASDIVSGRFRRSVQDELPNAEINEVSSISNSARKSVPTETTRSIRVRRSVPNEISNSVSSQLYDSVPGQSSSSASSSASSGINQLNSTSGQVSGSIPNQYPRKPNQSSGTVSTQYSRSGPNQSSGSVSTQYSRPGPSQSSSSTQIQPNSVSGTFSSGINRLSSIPRQVSSSVLNQASSVQNRLPGSAGRLPVTSSGELRSSESNEISERAELQIIKLCTQVPTYYEQLVDSYVNLQPSSTEELANIQAFEAELKSKAKQLRQYVNEYDERVSSTDPDAAKIQALMSSAVDELVQSVDKIDNNLNAEITQTAGTMSAEERMKTIQGYVRPAMVKFEEFCLLQTKDILKNVLQDYEASLLA